MIARYGITSLQLEKSMAHGPKYFCAYVNEYDIENYLKKIAVEYHVFSEETAIFVQTLNQGKLINQTCIFEPSK